MARSAFVSVVSALTSPVRRYLGGFGTDVRIGLIFLTRLPVTFAGDLPRPRITAAMRAFPAVGAITGAIGAAVFVAAAWVFGFPLLLAAALAVTAQVLTTGVFHEDGLADTADGLGGGLTAERKLEILKDSRIGSYGAAALFLALALRIAALASFASLWWAAAALIAGGAVSRAVIVAVMHLVPPARGDGQSAAAGRPTQIVLIEAVLMAALVAFLALPLQAASLGLLAAAAGGFVVARSAWRQIGGQTGDILGASQQVSEIAFLLAVLVFLSA